ncbi:MAG: type II secretion system protein [Clostridia bacterium]|nr:type II secretion system protein [Clostridia bacterium]
MKNRKRGFTIVELVIVIAVIGILSAVLIPVFSGLIAKANLANDNVLVKNINTQLAAAEIDDGKNVTMYDALQDAKEAGYLVANINARSNNQLVWDSTIDRFALIDQGGNVIAGEVNAKNDYELWKISKTVDAKYSTYYTGTETTVNTAKGFDAGENKTLTAVNYANSAAVQNVVIRTNSLACDLTINAANDKIRHYGEAQSINIVAVKATSYHEYGTAPFAAVNQGRYILEDSANVENLHVNSTSAILAIASTEPLPATTVNTGVTSYTVQTTQDDTGVVLTTATVTVNPSTGAVSLSTQTTTLDANTLVDTLDADEAKEDAVSNSGLVFQVKGNWAQIAANAKELMQDYVAKVYNKTNVMTEKRAYSVDEIYDLFPSVRNYFIEVGNIYLDVDSITINRVQLGKTAQFSLSVGSNRSIRANYYKVKDGKLYFAAPVAAFELMTNGTLKINNTNIDLGGSFENTLTVKNFVSSTGTPTFEPEENDDYAYVIDKSQLGALASWSNSYYNSYLKISFNEITDKTNGIYITRSLYTLVNGETGITYGTSTIDDNGNGNYGLFSYVNKNYTHWTYSVWFTGYDKACTFDFTLVD